MPLESGRIALAKSDVVRALKELLSFHGFEAIADYRVNGLSGYDHRFDVFAQRGELKLLIDVPEGVYEVIASLAKRIDVRGFDCLILARRDTMKGILPEFEALEGDMLRRATIIVFDNVEDLRYKLRAYLAARMG